MGVIIASESSAGQTFSPYCLFFFYSFPIAASENGQFSLIYDINDPCTLPVCDHNCRTWALSKTAETTEQKLEDEMPPSAVKRFGLQTA